MPSIQDAAAYPFHHHRFWKTGSSGQVGDDEDSGVVPGRCTPVRLGFPAAVVDR